MIAHANNRLVLLDVWKDRLVIDDSFIEGAVRVKVILVLEEFLTLHIIVPVHLLVVLEYFPREVDVVKHTVRVVRINTLRSFAATELGPIMQVCLADSVEVGVVTARVGIAHQVRDQVRRLREVSANLLNFVHLDLSQCLCPDDQILHEADFDRLLDLRPDEVIKGCRSCPPEEQEQEEYAAAQTPTDVLSHGVPAFTATLSKL